MDGYITISDQKLLCISDAIEQLEYIKSKYGDIPVRIARAKYNRRSEGDISTDRVVMYDANAITGNQWISNTAYTADNDIDFVIHNSSNGDYLELS